MVIKFLSPVIRPKTNPLEHGNVAYTLAPQGMTNLLTSWANSSAWRRTLHHGIRSLSHDLTMIGLYNIFVHVYIQYIATKALLYVRTISHHHFFVSGTVVKTAREV